MIAFVGLGNTGHEYSETKHNAGFWVVDELARRWKINFQPGPGQYVYAEKKDKGLLLVKPTIGMNKSGVPVKEIIHRWELDLSDLYIIVDDVDLPLGSIRIRPKGGDGCHRGMESIIYQLGNTHFPRIRFGIAVEGERLRPSEDYVLKPFKKKQGVIADEVVVDAADASESILRNGLNKTMNTFNS